MADEFDKILDEEVPDKDDELVSAFAPKNIDSTAMRSFGTRLYNQWSINKSYRRTKELIWLEDLRAFKGLYDPDVRIEEGNSKVYPKITRSKITIALSRLHEMLFPSSERNWEVLPTPEPRIAKEVVRQLAESLIQQNPETGEIIPPTEDDLRIAIKDFALETAKKMSEEIDDQFTEMDYPEETKKVLKSGLMYGTGIMKGPLISKRTKRRWYPVRAGEDYEEAVEQEDVPEFQFTRIWDWYPDMSTTEYNKIDGSFERHILTKHDLRELMKREDFYSAIIKEYLTETPHGDYTPENWEIDLQVIEVEAGTGKTASNITMATGNITTEQWATNQQMGKKYVGLEYWGYVDGSDLAQCGLNIEDVTLEYAANVWVLGRRVIKADLYEKALDQYKLFYYEKDETSLFGEGLARIMRHSQLAIAGGARMVLDNGSCVAGPNVEVNYDLMEPDTDLTSFYPRKIWYRRGRGIDAQYPALRVYNIDSHITELIQIIELFKNFGDEETTLPTWLIGQTVNNETAQATSGRMSTIIMSIKDVVRNFDSFTEQIIRDLYSWNMDFNPRKDIKGDFLCKARGVVSLVMKEIRMQALTQLTGTMTDEEWEYIPKRTFLEEKLKAHDINIRLLTEEEVAKKQEAQKQSAEMQLALEMQKAEVGYKKAQTMAQLTKAKKVNVEAMKDAQAPPETQPTEDPRLAEAELAGKLGDEARKGEAHRQDLRLKEEKHTYKLATDVAKTKASITATEQKVKEGNKNGNNTASKLRKTGKK